MGDLFIITNLQIVQGGLLQFDILNEKTHTGYRMFIEGDKFFGMLGNAMNSASREWMSLFNETSETKKL